MKSDTLLDHAVFQLSPKRSRCDLFVFGKGKTDKLASGFVMPFVTHLKAAEEQISLSVQAIKLEVERCRNSETWFTKGTVERFVRFVSTPEILELVNSLDNEMSQLEAAHKLYQGAGDELPHTGILLKAIDLRLLAVKQELVAAFSHAASAGFDLVTVSELQLFADQFSARRLNEACHKFLSLCNRRVDLTNSRKDETDERAFLSNGSVISIEADPNSKAKLYEGPLCKTTQKGKNSSQVCRGRGSRVEKEDMCKNIESVINKEIKEKGSSDTVTSVPSKRLRRLRIQDRTKRSYIKESSGSGGKPVSGKSAARRRLSTDNSVRTPSSVTAYQDKSGAKKRFTLSDSDSYGKPVRNKVPGRDLVNDSRDQVEVQSLVKNTGSKEELSGLNPSTFLTSKLTDASVDTQLVANSSTVEHDDRKLDFNWEEHDESQSCSEAQLKSDVNITLKTNLERVVSDPGQMKGIIGYSSENDSFSTPPASQVQMGKQSQGNLELNDKLKIKADELEKMFAEHKLRVPGESSSTRRRSTESAANSSQQPPIVDTAPVQSYNNYRLSIGSFSCAPVMELVENHGDPSSNHFSEFGFSEGSRGKYYDTYLQRRNKKLRDEWSSNREAKEAKLKAMHDSFEHSMAEIKAKLSGPADGQNSLSTAS